MVPNLLERVLMYGPLICMGYKRGSFSGSILRDHVTTLRRFGPQLGTGKHNSFECSF